MTTETGQQAGLEAGIHLNFRVFRKEDFVSFAQTESQGQERRSIVCLDNEGTAYVVKVPRVSYIKYHIRDWNREKFEAHIVYKPVTAEMISTAVAREKSLADRLGYYIPEEETIKRITPQIDWDETLGKPEIQEVFNQIEVKRMDKAKRAHEIHSAVVAPAGLYMTAAGWVGEVAPRLIGKHIPPGESLSAAQRKFVDGVVTKLCEQGMVPMSDMTEQFNLFVTGENPDDIRFIEPIFE